MKLELNTERAMMLFEMQPALKEIKLLLEENKIVEAQKTASQKILSLLERYKDMEQEKYDNTPVNLQGAPNSIRMSENVQRMEAVIGLFLKDADGENPEFRLCEEWNLDEADRLIGEIINS